MSKLTEALRKKSDIEAEEIANQPFMAFCPTCMARAKIPGTLPRGKRVKCPKCGNPFDPRSASSQGSDRIKVRQNIENESAGLPEWVWGIIIGAVCGVFFGALTGFSVGILYGSAEEMMGGSVMTTTIIYTLIGIAFYVVLGVLISVAMVLSGGSVGGYVIGAIGLVPALAIFGIWIGVGPAIVFTALVERVLDHKLYS